MTRSAARISPRLLDVLERAARGRTSFADIHREIATTAEGLGLPRPSYERVRVLVHQTRRAQRQPSTGTVLLEVAYRARPPDAVLDHLVGEIRPL